MKVGTDAMVLGAFVEAFGKSKLLDIGAGTGVLTFMLLQKNPKLIAQCIELDSETHLDLEFNIDQFEISKQISAYNEDFLTFHSSEKFDLIISNPPYYENGFFINESKEIKAKHSFSLPLGDLFKKIKDLLDENGSFWVILPFDNKDYWIEFARNNRLYLEKEIIVNGKPNSPKRVILNFTNEEKTFLNSESFTIRNENGSYTEEYKKLTKEFHNKEL